MNGQQLGLSALRHAVPISFLLALGACAGLRDGASPSEARAVRSDSTPLRSVQEAATLHAQGVTLLSANQVDEAQQAFEQALKADPYLAAAANNLGLIYLDSGDLRKAAELFERARKFAPESPDPHINLAVAFERGGRYEQALRELEQAHSISGSDQEISGGIRRLRLLLNLGQQTALDPSKPLSTSLGITIQPGTRD